MNTSIPADNTPTEASSSVSSRILTRAQLATNKHIYVCNATLLRWEKTLGFPRRFYLSKKMPAWFEKDVDAWLLAKSQEYVTAPLTVQATTARHTKRAAR